MDELQEEQTLAKRPKKVKCVESVDWSHLYSRVQGRRKGFLEGKDGNSIQSYHI